MKCKWKCSFFQQAMIGMAWSTYSTVSIDKFSHSNVFSNANSKFTVQIISQKLNMEFWQMFWYWGNPQDRQMLKAPPINPLDYISRTSKISPIGGRKYVLKYVRKNAKNREKVDNGLFPIKKWSTKMLCNVFKIQSTSA